MQSMEIAGPRAPPLRFLHDSITSWQLPCADSSPRYTPVAASVENPNTNTLYAGELEIRLDEGLVLATGHALTLSVREFELLAAMAKRAGAVVTRGELYSTVWGGELRNGDRSVDVYVSKLRGKLEAAMPDRRFIHTHPGFGYRFQPQPARAGDRMAEHAISSAQPERSSPQTETPAPPEAPATEIAAAAVPDAGTAGAIPADTPGLSRNVHIGTPGA
jgi:DNA-binding winged helix-turn-helix (wHTH) protein